MKSIPEATGSMELDRLRRDKHDLQLALLAANQRAEVLQQSFNQVRISMTAEIQEQQASAAKLQKLVQSLTQEKSDLEILVEILIEQGDDSAEDGEKARVDGLTQVANRRRFDEYLMQEWARHARIGQQLSLLLCDVDHFKFYNDRYGHPAGDQCLRTVAKILGQGRRSNDLVARYGGEEFAVLLPHTDLAGALLVADRVWQDLQAANIPHAASPVCGRVTLSIGVACQTPPAKAPDARALIAEADRNLYLSKQHGRNRVSHDGQTNGSREDDKVQEKNMTMEQKPGEASDTAGDAEYLMLVFSPLSVPLNARWRNNGLSADFIGDYVITFLPREGSMASLSRQNEFKHAVTYIVNELLENAMKYHAQDLNIPIRLRLELRKDHVTVSASNGVDDAQAERFKTFVQGLEQTDARDLLLSQQEKNASSPEPAISCLGLLTMIADYGAKLGWCFDPDPSETGITLVTISAVLPLTDLSGAAA